MQAGLYILMLVQTNILPVEGQFPVQALDPGGDLRGIALPDLLHGEVRGNNRTLIRLQAAVHHLIQSGLRQLCGQFTAQIIQDQQVSA